MFYKKYFIFVLLISFLIYFKIYNDKKTNKIIVTIFAGRKKYLEILMIYLNYLYKKNKIHEIHFWQFTNIKTDVYYLESISNIHKTSPSFLEYREIFPKIYNNKSFTIGIKSTKGGACLLLNNKYEIIFNINNSNYSKFTDIIKNKTIKSLGLKIPNTKYLFYNIEVIDHNLLIKENNNILFRYKIEEKILSSIKIHSEKNSENYWDYKEIKNKNFKLFDTEYRAPIKNWYEPYKYYLTYQYEILLKIDDDIIFIDVNKFDEFINFIRNNKNINVTIPNLINHAVSIFYNNKYGLLPNAILKKKYINKKNSNEIFDYYKDAKQAEIIHKYFLNNINTFINNNITPINLTNQKPRICMFGIKKENFIKVYNSSIIGKIYKKRNENNEIIGFNDEFYTFKLNNNYLFPKLICVHYQFHVQTKNGLTENLINDYKNLTKFLN